VGDTALVPGASHLMLLNLRQPLRVGDSVPVRLTLANGDVLVLNATVRSTQPNMQAPHEH
jgi:copper(I)-binding protein